MRFDYAAKIQGLIANAEDEALSDEARASYRAKAEELMRKIPDRRGGGVGL